MKANADPEDIAPEVWLSFAQDRTGQVRQRIFEAYLPFSRSIAGRIRRRRPSPDLDIGDLRQYAALGLLQAIDRYQPSRGFAFKAFAARRIAGSVIDGIGESSEERRQSAFRGRIRAERTRSLRIETHSDLSAAEALKALGDLAVELALGFILDEAALAEIGELRARGPNAYESLAWNETLNRVAMTVDDLPDRERTIVRLHYLEGLEFARIADTLNLSRGRVSQIHASALDRLRKRLPRSDQLQIQR